MSGRVLAERRYVLKASRQRVWDVLPSTIIQCIPVEQMEIVGDSSFKGVLNVRFGPVNLPFSLRVDAADISPPEAMGTVVTASKGAFRSTLHVAFALEAMDEDETAVTCRANEGEGASGVLGLLLRPQQRRFAGQMFDAIRERLESYV